MHQDSLTILADLNAIDVYAFVKVEITDVTAAAVL